MPRAARHESKSARYRQNKRRQGMKLLRIWVPDPNAPGFAEEVRRQAALLRDAPEQEEALDFIEAAARETWPE
ncbi:MAG: antitoxin MazE family protein [Microvirga sp.]